MGKTSLAKVFMGQEFSAHEKLTVGIHHFFKKVEMEDGSQVTLIINDLGGEHRFRFLAPIFLRGVRGCVFVYDITREETFAKLMDWLDVVERTLGDVPKVLVGNKIDIGELRIIPRDVAEKFAQDMGFLAYVETSAKEGINVEKPFMILVKHLLGGGIG